MKIDAYLTGFLANFDKFMEIYQGINGTIKPAAKLDMRVNVQSDETITSHFDDMIEYIEGMPVEEASLKGILDTMIGDLQQQKYLFTFN